MFNAPRRMGGSSLASSAFMIPSPGVAVHADPLASSMPNPSGGSYGDVDPWSAEPALAAGGTPRKESTDEGDVPEPRETPVANNGVTAREGLNALIRECDGTGAS